MSGLGYASVSFRSAPLPAQHAAQDKACLGRIIRAACCRRGWQVDDQLFHLVAYCLRQSTTSEALGSQGWFHTTLAGHGLKGAKKALTPQARKNAKNELVRRAIDLGIMERHGHWLRVVLSRLRWLKLRPKLRSKGMDIHSPFYPQIVAGQPVSAKKRGVRSCCSDPGAALAAEAKSHRASKQARGESGRFEGAAPPAPQKTNLQATQQPAQQALKAAASPPPTANSAAHAAVGQLENKIKTPEGLAVAAAWLTFAKAHAQGSGDDGGGQANEPAQPAQGAVKAAVKANAFDLNAYATTPVTAAMVRRVNAAHGLHLQLYKLRSAKIDDDALEMAVEGTLRKHAKEPRRNIEGSIMHAAIQWQTLRWGWR